MLIDSTVSGTITAGQLGDGDGQCHRNGRRRSGSGGSPRRLVAGLFGVSFDVIRFLRSTRTSNSSGALPAASLVRLHRICSRDSSYRPSLGRKALSSRMYHSQRDYLSRHCIGLGSTGGIFLCAGDQIMALTLEADQRLESVGLVALFDDNKTMWLEAAKETKAFISGNFPEGSKIRELYT